MPTSQTRSEQLVADARAYVRAWGVLIYMMYDAASTSVAASVPLLSVGRLLVDAFVMVGNSIGNWFASPSVAKYAPSFLTSPHFYSFIGIYMLYATGAIVALRLAGRVQASPFSVYQLGRSGNSLKPIEYSRGAGLRRLLALALPMAFLVLTGYTLLLLATFITKQKLDGLAVFLAEEVDPSPIIHARLLSFALLMALLSKVWKILLPITDRQDEEMVAGLLQEQVSKGQGGLSSLLLLGSQLPVHLWLRFNETDERVANFVILSETRTGFFSVCEPGFIPFSADALFVFDRKRLEDMFTHFPPLRAERKLEGVTVTARLSISRSPLISSTTLPRKYLDVLARFPLDLYSKRDIVEDQFKELVGEVLNETGGNARSLNDSFRSAKYLLESKIDVVPFVLEGDNPPPNSAQLAVPIHGNPEHRRQAMSISNIRAIAGYASDLEREKHRADNTITEFIKLVKNFSSDLDKNTKLISSRFPTQLVARLYRESASRELEAISSCLGLMSLELTEIVLELSLEGTQFEPEALKSILIALHTKRCAEIATRLNENARAAIEWYHQSLTNESNRKHEYAIETVKVMSVLANSSMTDADTRKQLLEAIATEQAQHRIERAQAPPPTLPEESF